MDNVWFVAAIRVGLALVATLLVIWLQLSTAFVLHWTWPASWLGAAPPRLCRYGGVKHSVDDDPTGVLSRRIDAHATCAAMSKATH